MPNDPSNDLEDFSLFELFRMEAEEQVRVLQDGLMQLESGHSSAATLESLMRAAHSLKGAARIVGLDPIVHLTHALEDRFVAAQSGLTLTTPEIDRLLTATDWLAKLQSLPEPETTPWLTTNTPALQSLTAELTTSEVSTTEPSTPEPGYPDPSGSGLMPQENAAALAPEPPTTPLNDPTPDEDIFGLAPSTDPNTRERTVRITATRFDTVLALASETLVTAHNLTARADLLERTHRTLTSILQSLLDKITATHADTPAIHELDRQATLFATTLADLDLAARANERTAERLYRTVLTGRLRPFADGITGVARLVRDTARNLNKQVTLDILGESTRVDRDILERLEAPITHLLSNAIDHGIETPADRIAAGKPAQAHLRLHARHENGRLVITVSDDGRGIDFAALRNRIVHRNLVSAPTAAGLSERELLEFLFLPGFSTRDAVSDISGRGVGLNIVQSVVQEAGGSVVITSTPGQGTAFRLTLPVTRSVIKVIRVQVEGEIYAVPLVRIDQVTTLTPTLLSIPDESATPQLEHHQHSATPTLQPRVSLSATEGGVLTPEEAADSLPVVPLSNLLGLSTLPPPSGPLPLLITGGIAFAVDRFIDEVELPVRRLDPRLGKVPGVSAASLDENGLPLLILDMEDLVQTALGRPLNPAENSKAHPHHDTHAPQVLIADDSHTVREMERRILTRAGYHVTTAQNGAEAWNLLRLNDYDLLVSDVDMPQMNGIELVTRLRDNPRLARMPVIILSYKDRDIDRQRGLDAGADFYLTKGDFQNNAFLQAVIDLIGPGTEG